MVDICPTYFDVKINGSPVADGKYSGKISNCQKREDVSRRTKNKIVIGEFHELAPEYTENTQKLLCWHKGNEMDERFEIRLSGSGGQGLILAGIILAEGIPDGKNAAQSQSYGPEARGGASRAELLLVMRH